MTKFGALLFLGFFPLAGCSKEATPERHHRPKLAETSTAPSGVEVDSAKVSMFGALPSAFESKNNPLRDDVVRLGQLLFHDPSLSKAGDVSCNTCHDLEKDGVDGKDFSTGSGGKKEQRNTPTVFDAAGAFVQFWDGRAETVEDGAKAHILSATEMAMPDDKHAVAAVKGAYADAFKKAFPDEDDAVTLPNIAKAIGAFERKLVTPSKWDTFVKGDKTALSDDEKKGFLKFVEVGCPTCHVGPLVGGTMYQKLGKEKPWPDTKDKGRSQVTKLPSDDMMFKVAALRNVGQTGPYFHDASAKTLEEAVKTMASYQLNKDLSDDDVKSITLWLKTLSGAVDASLVKPPELPAGGAAKAPKKTAAPAKK